MQELYLKRLEQEKKKHADDLRKIKEDEQEMIQNEARLKAIRDRDELNKRRIEESERRKVRQMQIRDKQKRDALAEKQAENLEKQLRNERMIREKQIHLQKREEMR